VYPVGIVLELRSAHVREYPEQTESPETCVDIVGALITSMTSIFVEAEISDSVHPDILVRTE
jgi:hypothetical protein